MFTQKNKVLSKGKTNLVEYNNTKNKTSNGDNSELKCNIKPEVATDPEVSSNLGKATPSLDNIIFVPDMEMDLEPKSWVENEKDYSSNQDKMSKRINHLKKYYC